MNHRGTVFVTLLSLTLLSFTLAVASPRTVADGASAGRTRQATPSAGAKAGAGVGLSFGYPDGRPELVAPGVATTLLVEILGFGGVAPEPGTEALWVSRDGQPFEPIPLVDLGGGLYEATLPVVTACAERLDYFLRATATDAAGTFSDPPGAPAEAFEVVGALDRAIFLESDFEAPGHGWTVLNETFASGVWDRVMPNGTTAGGEDAAPESAASGEWAFVTDNGPAGGSASSNDVDGGPIDLISPPINLYLVDAEISYARWFFSTDGNPDTLEVAVTADGVNWVPVEEVSGSENNAWTPVTFRVGDFVVPSTTVQVRFRALDAEDDSITEAGVDAFRVDRLVCDCATIPCDDGRYCNGAAACSDGVCTPEPEPCPGQLCNERDQTCLGTVTLQRLSGEPIEGLTPGQLERFRLGREAFQKEFTAEEGLGPIFNDVSCAACHDTPIGGSGTVMATRFGSTAGGFDPLVDLGGSLLQEMAIREECLETVPDEADVTANRVTTPALGSGLVEAIPDADIEFFELNPPAPALSGRVHLVSPREGGPQRIGRFGWKSQDATMMSFSSGATAAEMGITNRFFATEQVPNGDEVLLAACDDVADPEDVRDGSGFAFIDRINDFQRLLAPPPQTPKTGMTGETLFDDFGCASCHVPSFTTADDPELEEALRNKTFRPYSDFLLHRMGDAADFIVQGQATEREMRTAPLWGVWMRDPLWHDGRVEGGTFADRMRAAIEQHEAPGSEAGWSARRFHFADPADQDALVAFLASLGRAEFDHDGDNDVDVDDYAALEACFSGPGSIYTPDDPCAISDVDADGDVDDEDVDNFLAAMGAVSGAVPDGASLAGTPLLLEIAAGGMLELSWGTSCSPLDDDYEIYVGSIGDFASHVPLACTTAGETGATVDPGPDDVYFLIVPSNGVHEGGHGVDAAGLPRATGGGTCLPQALGACAAVD